MKTKLTLSIISAAISITFCFVGALAYSSQYLILAGALALTVCLLCYNMCKVINKSIDDDIYIIHVKYLNKL